jgi:guanylate kinase
MTVELTPARFRSNKGRPYAWLPMQAAELETTYGLQFERYEDDLDRFRVARITDAQAAEIWLWEYERVPFGGIAVIADFGLQLGEVFHALERQLPGIIARVDAVRREGLIPLPPAVPIVLHGPGGVGKDHVVDQLHLPRLVSTTDRLPRPGERDGDAYYFVHPDMFEALRECGAFAEHATVLGHSKGITRHVVQDAIRSGMDFVIRTSISGAQVWREQLAGAVVIRLLPLGLDQPVEARIRELKERLQTRAATSLEIERRVEELETEYQHGDEVSHYTVVNPWGRSEEAVTEILEIIEKERNNERRPRVPYLRGS